MNQCVKKLIASILFVFPLLMVTSVFADVEKTNESTQSENQSFDKTTFSEESITSETTESQSEASTNKRQEENKTSETSEVAEQTSDSSEAALARAVSADGYSEAATTEELAQLLADESVTKIRLIQPLTLDRELEIKRDIVIDFGGFAHNFGTHHIYINEIPQSIEFQNFKGTAAHPGGLTPNIDGNAIIIAYMTDFWGSRYHFTGEIKFTGTLDLYDGSKLGLIYAPRATVTLDGVSGVLDVQPVKEGLNAAPGKAYFCRSYQLNVINGSQLYGPYLGKFYGFLDSGDETGSGKTAPGIHILSGSKVSLDYDRADGVSDEGEAVDTLPGNVMFEVSGSGSEFSVNTKINITNDNNRGIIQ